MSGELANYASLGVALLAFGTVIYNAGRYGEKMSRFEKHIHEVRNELHVLPSRYVNKEMLLAEQAHLTDKLGRIDGSLMAQNTALNQVMIILGRLQAKVGDLHETGI